MTKQPLKISPDAKPVLPKALTKPAPEPTPASGRGDSKLAELPLISKLPKPKMQAAKEALEELDLHTYYIDSDSGAMRKREDRITELKELLQDLQGDLPGLRFGPLCFQSSEVAGRTTLSPELLIKNGVKASVIEASKVQGKGYTTKTFKKIAL